MTKKKIHAVPAESKSQSVEEQTNFYLDQVSDLNLSSVHFFDKASVTKTTMNRHNGNATIGVPAFVIQRAASNANFTIKLMHSCLGVDHARVIEGASNGNALLLFVEEAVDITRRDGSVVLERGDKVIMDNCPFHHGRFTKIVLRDMLAECGVTCCCNLLFRLHTAPTSTPTNFVSTMSKLSSIAIRCWQKKKQKLPSMRLATESQLKILFLILDTADISYRISVIKCFR